MENVVSGVPEGVTEVVKLAHESGRPRGGEELGVGVAEVSRLDVPPVLGDAAKEELEPA